MGTGSVLLWKDERDGEAQAGGVGVIGAYGVVVVWLGRWRGSLAADAGVIKSRRVPTADRIHDAKLNGHSMA